MHELDFATISYKFSRLRTNKFFVDLVFFVSSFFGFVDLRLKAPIDQANELLEKFLSLLLSIVRQHRVVLVEAFQFFECVLVVSMELELQFGCYCEHEVPNVADVDLFVISIHEI